MTRDEVNIYLTFLLNARSTYFPYKRGETGSTVELALKEGYRLIDCAHLYANEPEIGVALQKCLKEGVVKREDISITSKLWCGDMNNCIVATVSRSH